MDTTPIFSPGTAWCALCLLEPAKTSRWTSPGKIAIEKKKFPVFASEPVSRMV